MPFGVAVLLRKSSRCVAHKQEYPVRTALTIRRCSRLEIRLRQCSLHQPLPEGSPSGTRTQKPSAEVSTALVSSKRQLRLNTFPSDYRNVQSACRMHWGETPALFGILFTRLEAASKSTLSPAIFAFRGSKLACRRPPNLSRQFSRFHQPHGEHNEQKEHEKLCFPSKRMVNGNEVPPHLCLLYSCPPVSQNRGTR
jgi:hypothetical protein